MKKRRRISLSESFRDTPGGAVGAEGASYLTTLWYWIVGVPVSDEPTPLPPDDPDFVDVVPFTSRDAADTAFEEWLQRNGLSHSDVAPDLRIDEARAAGGKGIRRYRIRRGSRGDVG